jgi:hypothetical protein
MRLHTLWTALAPKRRLVTALTILSVLALAVVAVPTAHAQLSGSTFESSDGNMIVSTPGNEDWANAPNLTTATDFPSGAKTDNSFTTGSKEDDLSPVVGIAGVPPNKNDLIHFYTASETVGGQSFLYLAFTRAATSGNADIDFEVNHANLGTTPTTTPTQTGTCPSGTTNEFGVCVPLQRTDGDALFQFIFPGGGGPITALEIWRWASSSSSPFFVPVKGVTNSAGCLSTSSGPPCWSDPTSPSAGAFDGASNSVAITNPLDPTCSGNCLTVATFGEAAINLNATGIFPSGTCSHFGGAWAKSRSSDSGSSSLQDVIAPVPTNINNCATIKITKVTENGDNTFNYSTTGGLSPSSFTLSNGQTQTYTSVPSGTYTVTEGAEPSGWTFKSLTCSNTNANTSTSINGTTATITVTGFGEADCTYTNHTKLSPSISTNLSASSIPIGGSVTDSATLSGATANAGGTVTYTVYTDTACSSAAVAGTDIDAQPPQVTVSNSSVPNSASVTFLHAGTFFWQAAYSGDNDNNPATSKCTSEQLVVNKNSPGMTTAQHLIPNDDATISGATSNAGGTITFSLFNPSDATCSGTPAYTQTVTVNGDGTYKTTNTNFVASDTGEWRWQVSYSGDSNNQPTTSACGVENFTIVNG